MELFEHILKNSEHRKSYGRYLNEILIKFNMKITRKILEKYFQNLAEVRKNVIIKILEKRHKMLCDIYQKYV